MIEGLREQAFFVSRPRMRHTGTLTQWDDAKGYGFISPDDGGPRCFVHASALRPRGQRPVAGERLSFEAGADAQGKPRALDVRRLAPPAAPALPPDGSRRLLLIPAFAATVLACQLAWGLPKPLWGGYVAMSAATFITYFLDKRAARRGGWRVPERTLHLLALAGGWPGALIAQQQLRHKRAKPGFMRGFWACVGLNLLAFALLFTPLRGSW
jgi:uncharacterized membrane protein YsdA (DUF1294 family)/cold shock CspA family protein